jgi:hypothetical protein
MTATRQSHDVTASVISRTKSSPGRIASTSLNTLLAPNFSLSRSYR